MGGGGYQNMVLTGQKDRFFSVTFSFILNFIGKLHVLSRRDDVTWHAELTQRSATILHRQKRSQIAELRSKPYRSIIIRIEALSGNTAYESHAGSRTTWGEKKMTWNRRCVITEPCGSNHLGRIQVSFCVCLCFSRVKIPLIAERLQANNHHENNKKKKKQE